MNKTNKLLVRLVIGLFTVLLMVLAFFVGTGVGENYANKDKVTSTSIYQKITSSATLTTQEVYINQKSKISVNNDSDWDKLLWGQTITSEGLMKVSVGVDLAKVTENNISVDTQSKRITINLPAATILSNELVGDIEMTNQQGILKMLLASDPNADFNSALNQLKSDAANTVTSDESIMDAAFQRCKDVINSLYKGTGYTIVVNQL